MARPTYLLQVGFASSPETSIASTTWTDITSRLDVKAGVTITRGRTDEQGDVQPSKLTLTLDNRDGALTPGNASSPYYPNVRTGKRIRLGLVWLGTTYWRFTGDVDEWPLAWDGGPAKYAETKLTATDRFKRLGDLGEFRGTLEEDVLDDSPIAYYPMQETVSATSAGDTSGRAEVPLTVVQVGSGGTVVFDNSETSGTDSFYDATTTVGFGPAASGLEGKYLRATLRTPTTPSTAVGAGASVVAYAREAASGPIPLAPIAVLTAGDGSWFGVTKTSSGNIGAAYYDALSGTLTEMPAGFGMPSASAAQLAAVLDVPSTGNARITFRYGAVVYGSPVTFALPGGVPSWTQLSVGGRAKTLFRGNIAHVSFFATALASGPIVGQWYSAYRGTDGAGSTSYARLAKHCVYTNLGTLTYAGGAGGFVPQPVGGQQIRGNPIEAMRLVEATENGMFYLDGGGTPVLRLRGARYNATAALTLAADRLDPDAITFRGDDYGLVNDVTVSSPQSGGATARIINTDSVNAHGRRKASEQAIPSTDDQARALAAWKANTGGVQRNRITGVRISLLNDTALIPAALALAPGQKIAVTSLPSQAPAAALELFAEGWTEVIGELEWSMEFVTSPGEVSDVWQIGVPGRSEIGTTTRIAL